MKGERRMIYKNIHFQAAPFSYELSFEDRITLVGGDSGTGKTVLYEMLADLRLTEEYNAIKLFNYQSDHMTEELEKCRNCFIVIDNADILLSDRTRKYISLDEKNQYLIIGRNPQNLFTTKENLFELISEKVGEQTKFTIREYL